MVPSTVSRRAKKHVTFLSEGLCECWTQVVVENVLNGQASAGNDTEEIIHDDSPNYTERISK